MSAERTPEMMSPKVFPECADCEFAQRATEIGLKRFPEATKLIFECSLSGGGGARQVEPGKFVEYKSRYINVKPDKISDNQEERLQGFIPTCPVDISDSPEKYPEHPHMYQVGKDYFGRGFRYKVPTSSPK
jgi:hypothetical protein